jgi:hypothetical protein
MGCATHRPTCAAYRIIEKTEKLLCVAVGCDVNDVTCPFHCFWLQWRQSGRCLMTSLAWHWERRSMMSQFNRIPRLRQNGRAGIRKIDVIRTKNSYCDRYKVIFGNSTTRCIRIMHHLRSCQVSRRNKASKCDLSEPPSSIIIYWIQCFHPVVRQCLHLMVQSWVTKMKLTVLDPSDAVFLT